MADGETKRESVVLKKAVATEWIERRWKATCDEWSRWQGRKPTRKEWEKVNKDAIAIIEAAPETLSTEEFREIEKDLRSMVEHDNELMNHRIIWFLTINGFLFTAIAIFGNQHWGIDVPEDAIPDDQPDDSFLDEVTSFNNTAWMGWTAPVYAAVFGRREVYDLLRKRASVAVRRQAEAVWAARQAVVNN